MSEERRMTENNKGRQVIMEILKRGEEAKKDPLKLAEMERLKKSLKINLVQFGKDTEE